MRAGIQADDLTGACDTGAVFAAHGFATLVLLPGARDPASPPEVLVVDSESRGEAAPEARARVRTAVARLAAAAPALLYAKVDSTLRGPLAAQLAGALEGSRRPRVILAPALPAQRRAVVEGTLRIDGRPAGETATARDPAFPATGASALALLGVEGPFPVAHVPLATVRRGPGAVMARLGRLSANVVCDAETDDDLAVLAAACQGDPGIVAGSAGLAAAFAAREPGARRRPAGPLRGPVLVVAGSLHPLARAQVARVEARGGRVLTTPSTAARDREAPARDLARAARRAVEQETVHTLLLTGGETAYSVCRALDATALALGGEIEPGVATGVLLDGPFEGLTVVTKAGGFGDPDTLVRVLESAR